MDRGHDHVMWLPPNSMRIKPSPPGLISVSSNLNLTNTVGRDLMDGFGFVNMLLEARIINLAPSPPGLITLWLANRGENVE